MYINSEDVDFVLSAIDRLHSNRRNHSTRYTNFDGEHCLAGQVLAGLGVPVPSPSDDCNEAPFTSTATQAFYASLGIEFSENAEKKIQALQDAADWGVTYNEQITWGTALQQAS